MNTNKKVFSDNLKKYLRKEGNIFIQNNGLPIDRHHFYKHIFSPIREKLKLSPDLVPRSCRKTGSSLMAEAKIPDVFRKKIIGHEDIQTTNKYYTELDYKNLNDAINMI